MKTNSIFTICCAACLAAGIYFVFAPGTNQVKTGVHDSQGAAGDAGISPTFAQKAEDTNQTAQIESQMQVKIGVYDSRAVAVAAGGSPMFAKKIQAAHTDFEKAKQAGDTNQMAQIKSQMQAQQQKLHMQGFSTAPVDDWLQMIAAKLPQIKKDAGVDVLVSKWDEATLKKYQGATQVNVTTNLIDAFEPSAKSRNWAIQIQTNKPISLKEAENLKD